MDKLFFKRLYEKRMRRDRQEDRRKTITQQEFDETVARHNIFFDSDVDYTREQLINSVADFSNTDLRQFSFEGLYLDSACFQDADMRGCNLTAAEFKNAEFMGADLRGTNITSANFSDANLHGVKFDRNVKCRSARLNSSYGSPRFKRFVEHQDYIEEFRGKLLNKPVYYLWLVTSDCGRSLWLWMFWSMVLMLGYAGIYSAVGANSFVIPPMLKCNSNEFFIFIYYSVVTFTTLGFGDVTPGTTKAAAVVMSEVIMGYIMLGGLISIFSNKLVEK